MLQIFAIRPRRRCFGVWLGGLAMWFGMAGSGRMTAEELLPPDRSIPDAIDFYIDSRLREEGVTPAERADDATLLRRTMLDLVGRIATVHEARSYVESNQPDKRQQLVERLMASEAFVRQQAIEFDTMLMFESGGSLRGYLETAIRERRGWDRMFREMLLGDQQPEGSSAEPADPKTAPEQFVLARVADLDKLTNEASVTFFGVNVSCAQCHDHPIVPEWTQDHFYGMKSFFNRSFENGGFLGEREYGTVKFQTTDGESRDAQLMFLTGTVLDEPAQEEPSAQEMKTEKERLEELKKNKQPPPAPGYSRRARLVDIALQPEQRHYFARAIVNKLWYRLLGHGLVMPVDQMHPENPPTHPELLDWLARDLVTHDYDLARLIRGMVLSEAYARGSRWTEGERAPSPDLFAVAQVRPLTPTQYATSLRLASTNPDLFAADVEPEQLRGRLDGIFQAARGFAAQIEQPHADFQIGASEALLLSNSEQVENELLRGGNDSLLGKLATLEDRSEQVATAVWTVYGRAPRPEEQKLLETYLAARDDRPAEACRQMVWSLLSSSPCRFNY